GLLLDLPADWASPETFELDLRSRSAGFGRTFVRLGRGAQARLVLRRGRGEGAHPLHFHEAAFRLEAGSRLELLILGEDGAEDVRLDSWGFALARDSSLSACFLSPGGRLVRSRFQIDLEGENAEAKVSGLAVLDKERQSHGHLLLNHLAPHCRSEQLFKHVLLGSSRASLDGTVRVAESAGGASARQTLRSLMLSSSARASGKPRMEILNGDVFAQHGATVGEPDKGEIFYLQARGLERQTAVGLLALAFAREVLADMPCAEKRAAVEEDYLGGLSLARGTRSP
ncbi:MAG: SufD family Fe-S cluster assembly protein, partial [Planctomycetes bacterium]|nr:SufD family Fe-S cluster assembly protein [Planctomycetota bacterium]